MSDFRKSTLKLQSMSPHERLVKLQVQMFARSSFRKKGPGVVAQLVDLFGEMDQSDLAIMRRKGWDRGLLKISSDGNLRW